MLWIFDFRRFRVTVIIQTHNRWITANHSRSVTPSQFKYMLHFFIKQNNTVSRKMMWSYCFLLKTTADIIQKLGDEYKHGGERKRGRETSWIMEWLGLYSTWTHNSRVHVSMTWVGQRIVWKWAKKGLGWNFWEVLHYLKFKFQFLIFSDWFLNATLIIYDDIFQFL